MKRLMHFLSSMMTLALLYAPVLCPSLLRGADEQAPEPPPAATADIASVIAVPPGLTAEDVKASIMEAAALRKWQVVGQSEGKFDLSYSRGGMLLVVTVAYQTDQISVEVQQWDSRPKVVKTQQRWLNNLRKDITDALIKKKALKK